MKLGNWSRQSLGLLACVTLLGSSAGCAGDDDDDSSDGDGAKSTAIEALDPTKDHYGKSYAEWGSEWWKWYYQLDMTDAGKCVDPIQDPTGEFCAYDQDADSPVFFLTGNKGGTLVRTKCVVPKGKAIFFPILNVVGDNGGVPEADQLSDEDLINFVDDGVAAAEELSTEVDGHAIPRLGRFKVPATRFSYRVPSEPNSYSCSGTPFSGDVDPSFQGGHYVLLPPLDPGEHVINFAGRRPDEPEDFAIDVTYELKVR